MKNHIKLFALGLLWSGLTPAYLVIPSDYERINHPSATLTLINPYISIKGKSIKGLKYRLDGQWTEQSCSKEDRNSDGKICGRELPISPGPHIISVLLCTRGDCMRFGDAWESQTKFTVSPREQITLDVKKLIEAEKGADESAFSRKAIPAKLSACGQALEKSLFINTCLASGVKDLGDKLAELHNTCGSTWNSDTDLLLSMALWGNSYLDPERCYTPEEIKKLPRFMVSYWTGKPWPPGTIRAYESSWSWARDAEEELLLHKYTGEDLRTKAAKLIETWHNRQIVIDQLINAILEPDKKLDALLEAAKNAPWNVNPSTPEGHRGYVMTLIGKNEPFSKHKEFQALLSQKVGGDSKMHCNYKPEIVHTMENLTGDLGLSESGWNSVKEFIKRTPTDESLRGCDRAFFSEIKSSVSLVERLRFLATEDCSNKRDKEVRGDTIKYLAQPDLLLVPEGLKETIRKEFSSCVPPDTTFADNWKKIEQDIAQGKKKMDETCKHKIDFELDKAGFKKRPKDWPDASLCSWAVETMTRMCSHEWKDRELAINAPKIKKIFCRAASGKENSFVNFKEGVLTFDLGSERSYGPGTDYSYINQNVKGGQVEWD